MDHGIVGKLFDEISNDARKANGRAYAGNDPARGRLLLE
jgi:hypothetical protein